MTKKDYELIATVIRESREFFSWIYDHDRDRDILTGTVVGHLTSQIILALSQDNAKFNSDIFRKACGLETN